MSFRKTAAVGVALGWVLATAVAASGEDRGQMLFNLCTQCHQENGSGDPVAAPDRS